MAWNCQMFYGNTILKKMLATLKSMARYSLRLNLLVGAVRGSEQTGRAPAGFVAKANGLVNVLRGFIWTILAVIGHIAARGRTRPDFSIFLSFLLAKERLHDIQPSFAWFFELMERKVPSKKEEQRLHDTTQFCTPVSFFVKYWH